MFPFYFPVGFAIIMDTEWEHSHDDNDNDLPFNE